MLPLSEPDWELVYRPIVTRVYVDPMISAKQPPSHGCEEAPPAFRISLDFAHDISCPAQTTSTIFSPLLVEELDTTASGRPLDDEVRCYSAPRSPTSVSVRNITAGNKCYGSAIGVLALSRGSCDMSGTIMAEYCFGCLAVAHTTVPSQAEARTIQNYGVLTGVRPSSNPFTKERLPSPPTGKKLYNRPECSTSSIVTFSWPLTTPPGGSTLTHRRYRVLDLCGSVVCL